MFQKAFFFFFSVLPPKNYDNNAAEEPISLLNHIWSLHLVQFGFGFFICQFGLIFLPLVIVIVIVIVIIYTRLGLPTLEFPISCPKEEEVKLQMRTDWTSKRCKDCPSLSGRNGKVYSEWVKDSDESLCKNASRNEKFLFCAEKGLRHIFFSCPTQNECSKD